MSKNQKFLTVWPFVFIIALLVMRGISLAENEANAVVTPETQASIKAKSHDTYMTATDQTKLDIVVNVKAFGAKGDGTTDDTSAISAALASSSASVTLFFPRGEYKVTSTIQINKRGVIFMGGFGDMSGSPTYGSQISYYGIGPCIQMGTDNGHDWDACDYDGVQSFTVRDMAFMHKAADTTLANGTSNYKAGSYCIRDWRGGNVRLYNVQMWHFEYGFWGIQSDINDFKNLLIAYCKVGIYAGPRSDQFLIDSAYAMFDDQAIVVDGARVRIIYPQIVGCGYHDTYPIEIKNIATSRQVHGSVYILNPWIEHYQGTTDYVNAEIGVGVNNGYGSGEDPVPVVIDSPYFIGQPQGSGSGYHKYAVEIGKGFVELRDPSGDFDSIDHVVSFMGNYTSANAGCNITARNSDATKMFVNNGMGSPDMVFTKWGVGSGITLK
jgi:hypothetical protein